MNQYLSRIIMNVCVANLPVVVACLLGLLSVAQVLQAQTDAQGSDACSEGSKMSAACCAEPKQPQASIAPTGESLADAFDTLLTDIRTDEGWVRYELLQTNPLPNHLQSLVQGYAQLPIPEDHNEKLSFLCNAYNVNILNQVMIADIPKRVLDVEGFFDVNTIKVGRVSMTLNSLENEYIRPMGDPRIHAALNCAAQSCPSLAAAAFRADTIDEQLEKLCIDWANDTTRNRVELGGAGGAGGAGGTGGSETIQVSEIFNWFSKDFDVVPYGGVRGFLVHFADKDSKLANALSHNSNDGGDAFEFITYDWSLNVAVDAGG